MVVWELGGGGGGKRGGVDPSVCLDAKLLVVCV